MKHLPIIDTILMILLIAMLIYVYNKERGGHKEMMDVLNQINNNTKK